MLAIGLVCFYLRPELLPNRLLEVLNIESGWSVFALCVASGVLLAGLGNATNISDGANGLLAGYASCSSGSRGNSKAMGSRFIFS